MWYGSLVTLQRISFGDLGFFWYQTRDRSLKEHGVFLIQKYRTYQSDQPIKRNELKLRKFILKQTLQIYDQSATDIKMISYHTRGIWSISESFSWSTIQFIASSREVLPAKKKLIRQIANFQKCDVEVNNYPHNSWFIPQKKQYQPTLAGNHQM